jgi:hypothetical protein
VEAGSPHTPSLVATPGAERSPRPSRGLARRPAEGVSRVDAIVDGAQPRVVQPLRGGAQAGAHDHDGTRELQARRVGVPLPANSAVAAAATRQAAARREDVCCCAEAASAAPFASTAACNVIMRAFISFIVLQTRARSTSSGGGRSPPSAGPAGGAPLAELIPWCQRSSVFGRRCVRVSGDACCGSMGLAAAAEVTRVGPGGRERAPHRTSSVAWREPPQMTQWK